MVRELEAIGRVFSSVLIGYQYKELLIGYLELQSLLVMITIKACQIPNADEIRPLELLAR
jgi:hypothetical protein